MTLRSFPLVAIVYYKDFIWLQWLLCNSAFVPSLAAGYMGDIALDEDQYKMFQRQLSYSKELNSKSSTMHHTNQLSPHHSSDSTKSTVDSSLRPPHRSSKPARRRQQRPRTKHQRLNRRVHRRKPKISREEKRARRYIVLYVCLSG